MDSNLCHSKACDCTNFLARHMYVDLLHESMQHNAIKIAKHVQNDLTSSLHVAQSLEYSAHLVAGHLVAVVLVL